MKEKIITRLNILVNNYSFDLPIGERIKLINDTAANIEHLTHPELMEGEELERIFLTTENIILNDGTPVKDLDLFVFALKDFANSPTTPKPGVEEWISVDDRMPEELKTVICYSPNKNINVFCGYYGSLSKKWVDVDSEVNIKEKVTHWRELPAPPEQYAKEK